MATYYFDSINGNDSWSGTTTYPYKSINKLNSLLSTVETGTTIYLKRGSEWYGTITPTKSGVVGSPITIDAYGTGDKPIITGFETLTGWTQSGSTNIWYKTLPIPCQSKPTLITIDGIQYGMGRYPKAGTDLTIDSFDTNVSITDADLNSSVTNWTGAKVIIRKNEYSLDTCSITNHVGSTLTYTNLTSSQESTLNSYYFIQDDIRTLTQYGDWYYNENTYVLYVYFDVNPSSKVIKVPSIDNLFFVDFWYSYININNLSFEGSTKETIYFYNSDYGSIKNCNVDFSCDEGIHLSSYYGVIDNNIVNHTAQFGIYSGRGGGSVTNNIISNVGVIEGVGLSGSHSVGISVSNYGNINGGTTCQYNSIDSTAYHGIHFGDQNMVIKNNIINNYLLSMNDGGGIYTGSDTIGEIDGNIILNGFYKKGVLSYGVVSCGIYLDNESANITVNNNTIAYCFSLAINLQNSSYMNITNNKTYDVARGLSINEWGNHTLSGLTVSGNQFFTHDYVSGDPFYNIAFEIGMADKIIGSLLTMDYNYYPIIGNDTYAIQTWEQPIDGNNWQDRTLSNWQSYSGQDLNSHEITINDTSTIFLDYSVDVKSVTGLTGYSSIDGTPITSYTLQPYSSIILLETSGIYFDSINGNDSWSGTTQYPYKSLSKLNSLLGTVETGTTIYLKRGSEWYGTITPTKSGVAGSPITIDAYGTSETGITYQIWNNIGAGTTVYELTSNINYPNNPTTTMILNSMEAPNSYAEEYGGRMTGYICAPLTGNYTFWITSDDNGELWLSTNNQESNKQLIAYHTAWTLPDEWNKFPTQKSVEIYLVQNQYYYIEALVKEGGGGDSLTVGWLKPGESGVIPSEIIPGTVLYQSDNGNPILTGFETLNGWTQSGSTGIYYKTLSVQSKPLMVTINDVQYAMGKYPNTGWNYYESHTGTTQITDSQLTNTPNWTGAEIVLRTYDWSFEKYPITNHVNSTLTFIDSVYNDGTLRSTAPLNDGWGYFIQDSLYTLTDFGDWYYNSGSSTFYMYFGAVDPSTKIVKVSVIDELISFPMVTKYINISNIQMIGANLRGLHMLWGCEYINVDSCNIDFTGNNGVMNYSSKHITFNNLTINHSNDIGIFVASWYTDYSRVTNCVVNNTGLLLGQGDLGFNNGMGILLGDGIDNLAEYNTVINCGYSAMVVGGVSTGVTVRYNYIDNFCINKTDGGGIYTGNDDAWNMIIEGNIVLNGIGGVDGESYGSTPIGARGIYPDFNDINGLIIRYNTVAHCSYSGIFTFMGQNILISGNTIYDCLFQWSFQENDPPGPPYTQILNITSYDNIFVAKELTQQTLYGRIALGHTYAGLGTFDRNVYTRPIDDATTMQPCISDWGCPDISLSTWKSVHGQDLNSTQSPISITNTDQILFEYNSGLTNKVVSLKGSYKNLKGGIVNDSITLLPFSSIILLKYSTSNIFLMRNGKMLMKNGKVVGK